MQELKLQLMAKSAICPGLITIIWSLITSNSTGLPDIEDSSDELIEYINNNDRSLNNFAGQGGGSNQAANAANLKTAMDTEARRLRDDLEKIKKWQFNYLTGIKYELYRVPFKLEKFEGLKFKEVCMILYYKLGMTLIGLEIKVGNQVKVFVNPAEYVFTHNDHWGYVIFSQKPNYVHINEMDLQNSSAENFYIMHYLKKREFTNSKKEFMQKHSTLARIFEENEKKH